MTRIYSIPSRFFQKKPYLKPGVMKTGMMAVLTFGATALMPMNIAWAQEEGRQFSAGAGEAVNQALELVKDGDTDSALSQLKLTILSPDLNAYERSMIYQMTGQYSYELGRLGDAIEAFEKALSAGGLLPKEAENTKVVTAQLMIGNGQFRDGAERLETFLATGAVQKPEHLDLLVKAWVQAGDFARALPWAEKWFEVANPKERAHFDLLNYLFNSLDMQDRQADLVKEMIRRWPEDRALWDVWASMLSNGGREKEAFEVKKMLYLKGVLKTEDELLKIIQYYSFYDMPYQAAEILEEEMDANRISRTPATLTQLSDLFRQAREYKRAIPILESAALQSGDGKIYAAWGEALYNEGECEKSEAAFSEAINRGYDAGKSWMLTASCRYDDTVNLERLNCGMSEVQMAEAPITRARNSAIEAFSKVPKTSAEHKNAKTWIQFIETEKQAVKLRCEFEEDVRREGCFKQIEDAIREKPLSGLFTLDDPVCEKYVAEYQAAYGRGSAPE